MFRVEGPSRGPVILAIMLVAGAGVAIWYLVFRPIPTIPAPRSAVPTSCDSSEAVPVLDLASSWDESEVNDSSDGTSRAVKKSARPKRRPKPSVRRRRIRNANRLMMVVGPKHGLVPPPPPPIQESGR